MVKRLDESPVRIRCPNCGNIITMEDMDSTDQMTMFYGECKCEFYYNLYMKLKDEEEKK
jgi:predicted RNA-binding Zn-ribbon protein involved in translation (DUF1610 family)